MKKTTALLAALAVSLFCVNAFAQAPQNDEKESFLFNHWSLGAGISITNGINFQAAGTILPNLQVRVSYNTFSPVVGIANGILKNNANIGSINPFQKTIPVNINKNGIVIDNLDVEARLQSRQIELFVDFLPSEVSNIRFTGGVIVDLTPRLINATANPSPALSQSDRDKEFFGISTDPSGVLHLYAAYGLKTIRPYLGVGFGRPVDVQKRVTVNFDLGVAYTGGVHLYSQSYFNDPNKPEEVELNEDWVNKYPDVKDKLGSTGSKVLEYVGMANSFPIWPYLRLSINCRLF